MKAWLKKNKLALLTISFLLMVIPAIPLYYGAGSRMDALIYGMLALIFLGNLLAVITPS